MSVSNLRVKVYGNGDEISIEKQYPNTGSHWDKVDEYPHDDGGTYLYNDSADSVWKRDLYYLASPDTTEGVIQHIRLYATTALNVADMQHSMKIGGTVYDYASDNAHPGGWGETYKELTTNPATGLAWTWSDIANLQVGVRLKDLGTPNPDWCYCTQVYLIINIEYDKPLVGTTDVTDITNVSATGLGKIVSVGDAPVTEHGHCWNTTGNPTTADTKTTLGAGSVGDYTSAVTGLNPSTLYYIAAYATNLYGTGYGSVLTFTTTKHRPQVIFI